MRRSLIAVATVCICLAALAAAVALAATKTYPGKTTISISEFGFRGHLTSPLHACEKGRFMTIYSVANGGSAASIATTDANGAWKTRGGGFVDSSETYVVTTPAKILPKQGDLVRTCGPVKERLPGKTATP